LIPSFAIDDCWQSGLVYQDDNFIYFVITGVVDLMINIFMIRQ